MDQFGGCTDTLVKAYVSTTHDNTASTHGRYSLSESSSKRGR